MLIKLHDPSQAEALIAESHRRLRPIPFIADYTCGRHLDTGRPSVDGSYDVGLIVSFRTPADYRAYLDHPDHTAMVSEWRPRWESARIYDVLGSDR